jgi:hypothetical protein
VRIRAVGERLARIYDPDTPADVLAGSLGEQYEGAPVAGWMVAALQREGSPERLADAARLMLAGDSRGQGANSLTALTFAAAVAGAAGDAQEERRLIDRALAAAEQAGDRDTRLDVISFLSTSGHAAEAVELLEPWLREQLDLPSDLDG